MTESVDIDIDIRGRCRPTDREIAELAARQHGVVARRQLLARGFESSVIDRRVSAGRLHPVHGGVYAVGHALVSRYGRRMAAVLACGDGALLSHRSAAALWDLLSPSGGEIDVTAVKGRRGAQGVRVHRARGLADADRRIRQGIPVTSVSRTLVDIAGVVDRRRLTGALEQAERLQLFDLVAIERLLDRGGGRRGGKALRLALAAYSDRSLDTRSELERRFLALCATAGLPAPEVNVRVAGLEVDALWRAQRLIVELDGYEYHRTRPAFERDRKRDATLVLAGYRVLRFTSRRIGEQPEAVAAEVSALLAGPSS